MKIQKAQRKQVKLKLNLSGPSGSGKTMSALRLAFGLVNDWTKIVVIDSENGSASLYSHLGEFNTLDLQPPFSPERYNQAIDACIAAGMECIIIDSATHEWHGAGGCLEENDKLASAKYKGNTWSAWSETGPRHDEFVNKILQAPCHIITCSRSKMETVMGDDKKVKKVGMKDMQREGWEYEMTVSLNIDRDTHMASASKDRTNVFEKAGVFLITEETGKKILEWCNTGITAEQQNAEAEQLKTQEEEDRKKVYAEYIDLIENAPVTFTDDEKKKYLPEESLQWPSAKIRSAIARVTAIINDKVNQQINNETAA